MSPNMLNSIDFNQIYVMDGGSVVENGTHQVKKNLSVHFHINPFE